MNRFELIEEIVRLCKEAGYAPDEIKLRKKLSEYSTPDIERFLDACYRFGFREIITYI